MKCNKATEECKGCPHAEEHETIWPGCTGNRCEEFANRFLKEKGLFNKSQDEISHEDYAEFHRKIIYGAKCEEA